MKTLIAVLMLVAGVGCGRIIHNETVSAITNGTTVLIFPEQIAIVKSLDDKIEVGQVWVYENINPFESLSVTNMILAVSNGWIKYSSYYNSAEVNSEPYFRISRRRIK